MATESYIPITSVDPKVSSKITLAREGLVAVFETADVRTGISVVPWSEAVRVVDKLRVEVGERRGDE